jgi:hypothetical protein
VSANILDQSRIARRGRISCLFLLPFAVLLASAPAFAADPAPPAPVTLPNGGVAVGGTAKINLFEAKAIPVDATASNVNDAREQAFTDGRIAALQVVLARLVAKGDLAKVPQVSANDVIEMVQEFSVSNERTSAVRYLADLTVRFSAEAVRQLLHGAHVPFSEVVSRPMVLLPVYTEGGTGVWDNVSPWRDAFVHLQDVDGLVPLVLPAGDAEDAHLTNAQVSARDTNALAALAARYDAAGVVIATARGGAGSDVQITLTEVRGLAAPADTVLSSPAGASREESLATAAKAAVEAISDSWKRQSKVEARQVVLLTALATIDDIKEWIKINEALKNVPLLRADLQAITRDRAQVNLHYEGDLGKLEQAFAQQGLVAEQDGAVWMLSLPHQGIASPTTPSQTAPSQGAPAK